MNGGSGSEREERGISRFGEIPERLRGPARNAARICLGAGEGDRAIIIYDSSTRTVAGALGDAFEEAGATVGVFDMDAFGSRPFSVLPGAVSQALSEATVSALALTTRQGELSVRRAVLEIVSERGIRHAHMPSITEAIFADGLSMDYREVSRFIGRLVEVVEGCEGMEMRSDAGTDLSFRFESPPELDRLDGLIGRERWQNLPSGQIIVYPADVNGVFVVDRSVGDWFEHKYRIADYPVTLRIERGLVKDIACDNQRLRRDLWLFLRSSENSGRVSELVIGANLGLTQDHAGALFDGYRPGASISVGSLPAGVGASKSWHAATFLPLIGKGNSLLVGERVIMEDDAFASELVEGLSF